MERVLLALLCLSGWFILPSCPLRQYYFVNETLTWHEAQTYCRERFTDLATIESMTEMNQLIDMVSSTGYNSEVWIGAFSEIKWKWSDGSKAEYRHWGRNQPNYFTAGFCVLSTAGGNWGDTLCRNHISFICYKGTQVDPKFVVVNEKMNWSSAQKHCRENFIDLATVRNDVEHKQVYDLVPVVAWIGLFRDPNFHWSDGSSFVFGHFDDAPDTYGLLRVRAMCAAAFLNSSGKWRFLFCETRLPFVCYNPVINKQVVKLRIKLDDSSVDLNDPAVKAALLKKLQDRLKEEGVSGVTLKWREQPDGEVWHKEDP